MTTTEIRLSDMGTTGLIDYVLAHSAGRLRALAKGRAINVLRARGYAEGAIWRFRHAVSVTSSARNV